MEMQSGIPLQHVPNLELAQGVANVSSHCIQTLWVMGKSQSTPALR